MDTHYTPEIALRELWRRQQFQAGDLHTSDGHPVMVLSPGRLNEDGGPDFIDAIIRIGPTLFRGDVEIHCDAAAWDEHRHGTDPHYNRVILHVVLNMGGATSQTRTASRRTVPVLVIRPGVDDTPAPAGARHHAEETNGSSAVLPCATFSAPIPTTIMHHWLTKLAHDRIELKMRRFEERLKQLAQERRFVAREPFARYHGRPDEIPAPQPLYERRDFSDRTLWEQLLYEAIMEGLGYSKNNESFLSLARSVRVSSLRAHGYSDAHTVMAILFGAAGLLPSTRTIEEKESRLYVRHLRRRWRELRPLFAIPLLHEADWQFFRLRPSNFPTARLAAMVFLLPHLFGKESLRSMVHICTDEQLSPEQKAASFRRMFRFEPDGFWRHHYHFHGIGSPRGVSLGRSRINDILVNGVFPILLLYARLFHNRVVRANVLSVLESFPAGQENGTTRLIFRQLLHGGTRFSSALEQQGALHLYGQYCARNRCAECPIGHHVFPGG